MNKLIIIDPENLPENPYDEKFTPYIADAFTVGQQSLIAQAKPLSWLDKMYRDYLFRRLGMGATDIEAQIKKHGELSQFILELGE